MVLYGRSIVFFFGVHLPWRYFLWNKAIDFTPKTFEKMLPMLTITVITWNKKTYQHFSFTIVFLWILLLPKTKNTNPKTKLCVWVSVRWENFVIWTNNKKYSVSVEKGSNKCSSVYYNSYKYLHFQFFS